MRSDLIAYRKAVKLIQEAAKIQAKSLNLSGLGLSKIPSIISSLFYLKSLNLSNNQIDEIPLHVSQLVNLKLLTARENNITEIDSTIDQLVNLEFLDLSNNKIHAIPCQIDRLTALESLALNNNSIVDIPREIGKLTSLKYLDLSYNKINEIPSQIGWLDSLTYLDLSHNTISKISPEISRLYKLKSFRLDYNYFSPTLYAAYERGFHNLLKYLEEETSNLYEAKLILVGEGAVGKSSLLAKLRSEEWVENRNTTHGIEIKPVSLLQDEIEMTLNAWDFGGQPVYRPTHQLYFTAPAIYLVVWKPRDGAEQGFVEYWIDLIQRRAYNPERPNEQPRVLVVATHGGPKQRQAYIDETALREKFGDAIVGFYHVDSHSGHDIDKLIAAMTETAKVLPGMGRSYPVRWQQVRESLVALNVPYLSYSEFQQICRDHTLDDEAITLFIAIEHQLGRLIHYANDDSLKDIVILKADWLSKAISFVLDDQEVKDQNGLIRHSRLRELWNDPARLEPERYPEDLYPIFLRLMEQFDLSYRVERSGQAANTSLIAQLVPGARPDGFEQDWGQQPKTGDLEQTQICRIVDTATGDPAKAEGLFYQLIVRLHRYSLGRQDYQLSRHWQQGLLLDDKYNGRALIERQNDNIRIIVRAALPERFLHQLCEEVKELVENFWKGINCQITVPCHPPCRGLFEIEALITARQKNRPEFPCRVCNEWISIDSLINKPKPNDSGIEINRKLDAISEQMQIGFNHTSTEYRQLMSQLADYLRQKLNTIQINLQNISDETSNLGTDIRRMMTQIDQQYDFLLTTLNHDGKEAPRLISIIPVEPTFWSKPKWVSQKIKLVLWCEHSRLPLPLLWNDESKGVYELEQPREWLVKVAPYAKFIATTLSLVLPIAGAGAKIAIDDNAKNLEEAADLFKELGTGGLGAMSKLGEQVISGDDFDLIPDTSVRNQFAYKNSFTPEAVMLREIQQLLKDKDKARTFGGLVRVQNKRGEFLWVHPDYKQEYSPDLPIVPID
jgi:C-terminal of Roc, COR, domain/Ras of Complex, Roc, domain of DAPkinase/Leucine rich repeat